MSTLLGRVNRHRAALTLCCIAKNAKDRKIYADIFYAKDKLDTHAEIAARLGVNRSTLFRHLKASREAAETPKVCLATNAEFAAVVNALAKSESTKPLIGKRAIAEAYDVGLERSANSAPLC